MRTLKDMRIPFILLILSACILSAHGQCINTFPYIENFENNNGNWSSGGTGDDWAWGIPSKSVISQAAGGSKCWITGGLVNSFYNLSERSYAQSPCFDFSSLQYPHITMNIFWETEKTFDGATFQSSIDGGTTWVNLGSSSNASDCLNQNWFNTSSITNLSGLAPVREGWAGNVQPTQGSCLGGNGSNGWKVVKKCMPTLAGQPNVIFRFAFGAGSQCNDFDGFAFDEITIGEAPMSTVDFTYTCNGNSYSFTGNGTLCPTAYNWDFGDGNQGTGLNATHQYATSGTYQVKFTATGSCNAPASVTKTLEMLNVSTSSLPVSCAAGSDGKAFVNNAQAGYTYIWNTSPAQTTDTAFNLIAGNYVVTVSAPNFCDVTTGITVNESLPINNIFTAGPDTCNASVGSIVTVTSGGNNPYSYIWSNSATTANINLLAAGNYTVTITDSKTCSASSSVTVGNTSGMNIQFTAENLSCYDNNDGSISTVVTGGVIPYTYAWSNGANASAISNLNTGTYVLTVSDINNCSASDSVVLTKEVCPSYIYFPTAFTPNGDGANETFRPKYSIDLMKYHISIYNRWGELVYESTDINEGWNGIFRNTLQPLSVYVWYAEYAFMDGKTNTQAGNCTLVK